MKKLDKNSKILLFLVILFLVFVVGTSFALPSFIVNLEGVNVNQINSCKLSVTLDDDTPISLINSYPISQSEALKGTPYNVTITKTGDCSGYSYLINMVSSCKTCTQSSGKCTINGSTCDCNNQISPGLISYYIKDTSSGDVYSGNNPFTMNISGALGSSSKTLTYQVYLWINANADNTSLQDSSGNAKDFCAKISADVTDKTISTTKTLYNEIASQVENKNISYQYINNANTTVSGVTYNNNDNGVFLFNGTDDNGGSNPIYYYRGNVTNNNVLFADLCWKIVRTTSTGGVKLIYNGEPTNGTCDNTGEDSQYGTSAFNSSYTSPADVGYMYGTRYTYSSKTMTSITDSYVYGKTVTYSNGTYTLNTTTTSTGSSWSTDRTTLANGYHYTCFSTSSTCSTVYYITYFGYSSTAYYLTFTGGVNLATAKSQMYTNTTNSTIKTKVDSFYTSKLSSYTSSLENTIFCNDRSFASGTTGGPLSGETVNSTSYSYYAPYYRIWSSYSPSLQCTNTNDRFSLSTSSGGTSGYGNNKLTYPIGLLTSDEVMLAGGKGGTSNSNYYLYTGQPFWLGSPFGWYTSVSYVDYVHSPGYLSLGNPTNAWGVRPSVSLQPETIYSEGDGTVSSPYKITSQ